MVGSGAAARDAVGRWAHTEPQLAGFQDLAEVVDRCHRRGDAAAANRLLAAVVRLADRDPLAGRTVLQAVLPGLAALSLRARRLGWCRPGGVWSGAGELDQELLALACERIDALAGQQLEWPASTIVGQVWRRIRMASAQHRTQRYRHTQLDPGRVAEALPTAGEAWEQQLTRLLCDAVRGGTLARPDGAVIYSTRVLGVSPAEVAERLDIDVRALWQRRRRAERALGLSVAA